MRFFLFLYLAILFYPAAGGQIIYHKGFFVTDDTSRIQTALEKVSEHLKAEKSGPRTYVLRDGIASTHVYQLRSEPVDPVTQSQLTREGVNTASFGNSIYEAAVVGMGKKGELPPDRVTRFLNAALKQELSDYTSGDGSDLIVLRPRHDSVFWKKNWFSQGKGAAYALDSNSFADTKMAVPFGYLVDAVTIGLIVGGPLFGQNLEMKITLPVLAILNSVAWKYFFNGKIIKGYMDTYNRAARSPYLVPFEDAAP